MALDQLHEALSEKIAGSSSHQQPERKPAERDSKGRVYATGKRKSSIARVWIGPGKGNILVNDRRSSEYFGRETLQFSLERPFRHVDRQGRYDVLCYVKGGGLSGQASAVCHGISKALQLFDPELRPILKAEGLLTRDARRVERKKAGRRKARRSPQFSKR